MKALLQHNGLYENVTCIHRKQNKFKDTWHYHPEIEVIYIKKGNGNCFIGDFVTNFYEGDLFIIGSYLPHSFKENPNLNYKSETIILYFNIDFLKRLSGIENEFRFLKDILKISQIGIKYKLDNDSYLVKQLTSLPNVDQNVCSLHALAFINNLYLTKEYHTFCTLSAIKEEDQRDYRLQQITNFTVANFENDINLNSVASIVGMNKSAFCRFFKQKTGKTYVTYLNEIRINRACQVLKLENTNTAITKACFKSGFNNLSYFNRLFKKYMGITPSQYLHQ